MCFQVTWSQRVIICRMTWYNRHHLNPWTYTDTMDIIFLVVHHDLLVLCLIIQKWREKRGDDVTNIDMTFHSSVEKYKIVKQHHNWITAKYLGTEKLFVVIISCVYVNFNLLTFECSFLPMFIFMVLKFFLMNLSNLSDEVDKVPYLFSIWYFYFISLTWHTKERRIVFKSVLFLAYFLRIIILELSCKHVHKILSYHVHVVSIVCWMKVVWCVLPANL